MTSQISKILSGYQKALNESEKRFSDMYQDTAKNAAEFYDQFFHQLVKRYDVVLKNPADVRRIKRTWSTFFGTDEVRFAAIDGTNFKDSFSEYMVFFGASYGVKGTISLQGDPPKVNYEKWSSDEDVSFVSYIPIPYTELSNMEERQFIAFSDDEKANLSAIDTQLMQLAEVFLAYDFVSTSSLRPKLLLMDHSMSSIMMSNAQSASAVNMIGYEHSGRCITAQDIVIAYSHPYQDELNIPYPKKPELHNFVLKELSTGPKTIEQIAARTSYSSDDVWNKIKASLIFADNRSHQMFGPKAIVEKDDGGRLRIANEYRDSWRWTVDLFKSICHQLFKEKDQAALRYMYTDEMGEERETWMMPSDLKFLISVGIRALIEECWKYGVLLIGIVKDSSSKFLSRNYLGVARERGLYEFDDIALPWTDRAFLETFPYADPNLTAPWSTIEFDASFMTVANRQLSTDDHPRIQGVRGDIIAPQPRLFVRSLGQFFVDCSKSSPLTGHVIFIDRLVQPRLDRNCMGPLTVEDDGNRIGKIEFITFKDKDTPNDAQDIMMFALSTLTRNLYPNVIGYPDPLHKADWGAKSIRNKIVPIIQSSGYALKRRPLNRTLRDIRARRG